MGPNVRDLTKGPAFALCIDRSSRSTKSIRSPAVPQPETPTSDCQGLLGLTRVPRLLWVGLFGTLDIGRPPREPAWKERPLVKGAGHLVTDYA